MACFWKACLKKISKEDINQICGAGKQHTPVNFALGLKRINETHTISDNITWQNQAITGQQKNEFREWIRTYRVESIPNGKLTGIMDPFFILLSDVFYINIRHQYLNHTIEYKTNHPKYTVSFKSNQGHIE